MYLWETDLVRRNEDASRTVVIILTAALGAILIIDAFVLIYLLYQQITRRKKQKATRIERGDRPPKRRAVSWHGRTGRSHSYQNQREFRDNRGIPYPKRSGGPRLPNPAHLGLREGKMGSRERDRISSRTGIRNENIPTQHGGMARR